MKKRLSALTAMIIIVVLSFTSFPAYAVDFSDIDFSAVPPSKAIITFGMEEHLEEAVDVLSEGSNDVSEIKRLRDFDGNLYYLVECDPGYYIMDAKTSMYVEYSPIDESPYINCTSDNLYYAGPTFFYEEVDGKIVHTIEREEVLDAGTIEGAKTASEHLQLELSETAEERIETATQSGVDKTVDGRSVVSYSQIYEPRYITGYTHLMWAGYGFDEKPEGDAAFRQGYVHKNCCGYIAANLLMYYWQERNGGNYVPASWMGSTYGLKGLYGPLLTNYLLGIGGDLGYGYGTTISQIYSILHEYQNRRGFSGTFYWFPGGLAIDTELALDRPVIVGGNLPHADGGDNINHAVVVYGNYPDGSLICNYGWPKRSLTVLFSNEFAIIQGTVSFIP